jgi:hypothetical protein
MNTDFEHIDLGIIGCMGATCRYGRQKFAVAGLDLDEEKVFHSHKANPQPIKATMM